ncbi:alpha/beta fold hydrolase [Brevibacillus centrosporus]|uniref:alpha/beta fold hydrolase n=1 Tax=Brevibacillus centrosporus TaxID=54910 RepID=UPI002E22F922|nr:alpha/beta fold hydrolase [Brevibacillus centrosporus]
MYAKINGTKIYFDVEGMGSVPDGPIMRQKPICFVLHGGPGGDHTLYKPYLTPLSELMQIVYIDNRGSGFSDEGSQSTYTLENNVEDVEALLDYLGLEKVVILGQSYGGITALSYAVKYPERIDGLVLISTSSSYRFLDRSKKILEEKGTEEQKIVAEKALNGKFESNADYFNYLAVTSSLYTHSVNPNPTQEDIQMMQDAMARCKVCYQAANEGFRDQGFLRSYDVTDQLQKVTSPTLIITGRHDWIAPVQESFEMAENLPDNELVIFEHSSHNAISEEYERFLSTVKGFVERRLIGQK